MQGRADAALQTALRAGRARLPSARHSLKGRTLTQIRAALGALAALGRVDAIDEAVLRRYADSAQWMHLGRQRQLPEFAEARILICCDRDRYGRRHWLTPDAARAWRRMRAHAADDGVSLELISSFRSYADQARIIARKLRAGIDPSALYTVNAPPGFSEHHSGRAVDIAETGAAALTESFELSPAFAWLQAHAGRHGFYLSYPRGNRFGFIYEPWHWCYCTQPARSHVSSAYR